jgi:hypothetical protein
MSDHLASKECLPFGSWVRSTSIRSYSDIDILLVFPESAEKVNPDAYLTSIAKVVDRKSVVVTRGRMVVSLAYSKGPAVDLVPALEDAGSADPDRIYSIPSADGSSWRRHCPMAQERLIADASLRLGPRLKGAVRMLKWWNRRAAVNLSSSEIERTACETIDTPMPEYPRALSALFESTLRRATSEVEISPEEDQLILSDTPLATFDVLAKASAMASEACDLQSAGEAGKREAAAIWRGLFGDQFPVVLS